MAPALLLGHGENASQALVYPLSPMRPLPLEEGWKPTGRERPRPPPAMSVPCRPWVWSLLSGLPEPPPPYTQTHTQRLREAWEGEDAGHVC